MLQGEYVSVRRDATLFKIELKSFDASQKHGGGVRVTCSRVSLSH